MKLEKTKEDDVGTSEQGTPRTARGGKLARRARSFKEDFLDILSAMRSPSSGSRASSPRPSKQRIASTSDATELPPCNPIRDLECHVRQLQFALKHFRDVVDKDKLEMVPGNGTVVLETVTTIHNVLKSCILNEQSSVLVSASNQVYQSVAILIKLCDDVLLIGHDAINAENVAEVLDLVEDAIQNLVSLASDKIVDRCSKTSSSSSGGADFNSLFPTPEPVTRISLPDIPLTPRERKILEETSESAQRKHLNCSVESIDIKNLNVAPPKPPLPSRPCYESPPPLPPKKRAPPSPTAAIERLSLKSDNSSSLGSLESMLNASSKDDDELRVFMLDERILSPGINGSRCWDSSSQSSLTTTSTEHPSTNVQHSSPLESPPGGTVIHTEKVSTAFTSVQMSSHNFSSSTSQSLNAFMTCSSSSSSMTQLHSVSNVLSQSNSASYHSNGSSPSSSLPALPEKMRRKHQPDHPLEPTCTSMMMTRMTHSPADSLNPPPLPPKKKHMQQLQSMAYSVIAYVEMFGNVSCSTTLTSDFSRRTEMSMSSTHLCSFSHRSSPNEGQIKQLIEKPPALPPKRTHHNMVGNQVSLSPSLQLTQELPVSFSSLKSEPRRNEPVVVEANGRPESPLAELDVVKWLVHKGPNDEGPEIRGGHPHALIVHATKANKNDFLYQEAFLTTYRTFISPLDLVDKLVERHQRFSRSPELSRQRAAREAFSLLVRVVSDLTILDVELTFIQRLMNFVYQLLRSGDLTMAKALRVKILEKHAAKAAQQITTTYDQPIQSIYTRPWTLLDFKSDQIAEQMTLLDAKLFMKIEIPEALIWAQEQNEERSPNLTRFTEHFNKMSYWARSRILEQADAKDREKYVIKFIKIMKHLRKMNNFNSYLALLSALDSAPIRRLEWQKHITEGLKEYCALIDSSSSFRAYRQALAETQPPCIPYIGLVLQDLTFVHIGNSDFLSEGIINFSKRWQQFNIVENMKRFQKATYNFKEHEKIIALFNNFDNFLCEETMWQISENIKPRGQSKKPN
ncbi:guanine nucleotide-releasing factor 2 isoform X2 [Bemisia tabaci]|uniref:guanine nucleotide-releasing factor 2 isoform X2 n=1 Tax=Bemisia tabaci TaxID=7038 RepID=UPI003B28DBEA